MSKLQQWGIKLPSSMWARNSELAKVMSESKAVSELKAMSRFKTLSNK